MRRPLPICIALMLASGRLLAAPPAPDPAPGGGPFSVPPVFRVLVFSRTAGFRHDSIPEGIAAVRALGARAGFAVDATEDAGLFTPANLAGYRAVVFMNTTGDALNPEQEAAFQAYIRHGGGFVGVHAATDTEHDWPWYIGLVGAEFASHPAQQEAVIRVEDRKHISTKMLPGRWVRFDEWYDFKESPRKRVHVLATLDESTYQDGKMGADHPTAWYHEYDGGRAWYTAGGHTKQSYSEPLFLEHLLGGIRWAARAEKATPAKTSKKVSESGR